MPTDTDPLAFRYRQVLARVAARRDVDQERLVATLQSIARQLVPSADPTVIHATATVLGDPTLCHTLDDLDRSAEAERTRLARLDNDASLRHPAERRRLLQQRRADADQRAQAHAATLAHLDTPAFRWLDARRRGHAQSRGSDSLWRTLTFAELREARTEEELCETTGESSFRDAARRHDAAAKGLRRARMESERAAHAAAALEDALAERQTLEDRVASEPSHRRRVLRDHVVNRLIEMDLAEAHARAQEEHSAALAEAQAVEVRLRGWDDLTVALERRARLLPTDAEGRAESEQLLHAADRVVGALAAFHDFERWQTALAAGTAGCCWHLMTRGYSIETTLPDAVLNELIPRLHKRPPARGTPPQAG